LPVLVAGNPTNYAQPTKLSTAEALSAALHIAGFKEDAGKLLSIFKWGHTFFDLNLEMLESYANAKNSTEVVEAQQKYMEKTQK
jgi:pre-rRNA-processing protein TSR3